MKNAIQLVETIVEFDKFFYQTNEISETYSIYSLNKVKYLIGIKSILNDRHSLTSI